ncbi:hypothetical protein [Streptomyces tanashiensis]|uniref:hypothetical protein n=1 Tax=Streptomyces tanashiensis TaxID=67367 RepID=UPI00167DE979|nr:hypothetical protein [Streptomyces tanashiensis]GGY46340.1 hypothetical protein GCM10010299_60520 [Streptomyces tanashiensis]
MTSSRDRILRTGAAFAVTALALTGCSTGQAGLAAPAAATATAGSAADPSTWTLPMEAYRPTTEQTRTLARAERKLVGQCLKEFGIDWKPDPELPAIGPKNLLDWRYGIHDAVMSAKFGYQVDPAQQARYERALREADARPRLSDDAQLVLGGTDVPAEVRQKAGPEARRGFYAGRRIPEGGCFGEARRTLGGSAQVASPLVQRLTNDSYPRSMEDPLVKAVFARWSACMKAKGYTYPAPMAANDDPRFRPRPEGASSAEIDTALADIGCRARHGVAEIWHEAETRIQRASIASNATALAADRRALDASLRKAADVLARS